MNRDNQEWMSKALAVLAVIIIAVLLFHVVSVVSFNQHEYTIRKKDGKNRLICLLRTGKTIQVHGSRTIMI